MGMTIIDRVMASGKSMRSPARLALASAIRDAEDAEAAVADARAALGRGHRMVDEAEERLAQASEAVATAKASQADRMASAAASGATLAPDPGMRQSRLIEADAEDELEAARAALASVEASAAEAEKRLEQAKINVSNCAKRVVKSVNATAIAKALALRAELDAKTLELTAALNREVAYLRYLGDKQCEESPGAWPPTDEDRQTWDIIKQENKILDWDIQSEAFATWKQSLAQLMTDADAALPVS